MKSGSFPRVRARGSSGGFTLLEVLVAFTILVISLTALYQVFGTGVRATRIGDDYATAVRLAQSQLSALSVKPDVEPSEERGEWGDRFEWRARVSEYLEPPPEGAQAPSDPLSADPLSGPNETNVQGRVPKLYDAEVVVSWQDGPRARSVTLQTLLFGTP